MFKSQTRWPHINVKVGESARRNVIEGNSGQQPKKTYFDPVENRHAKVFRSP